MIGRKGSCLTYLAVAVCPGIAFGILFIGFGFLTFYSQLSTFIYKPLLLFS